MLKVEDVRLERDLLVPDAAVVVLQIQLIPILWLELFNEGWTLAQGRGGIALRLLLCWNLLEVGLLCWLIVIPLPEFRIPVVPFLLPLRWIEIRDDLGLLRDEVKFIPF